MNPHHKYAVLDLEKNWWVLDRKTGFILYVDLFFLHLWSRRWCYTTPFFKKEIRYQRYFVLFIWFCSSTYRQTPGRSINAGLHPHLNTQAEPSCHLRSTQLFSRASYLNQGSTPTCSSTPQFNLDPHGLTDKPIAFPTAKYIVAAVYLGPTRNQLSPAEYLGSTQITALTLSRIYKNKRIQYAAVPRIFGACNANTACQLCLR